MMAIFAKVRAVLIYIERKMRPLEKYQYDLQHNGFSHDSAQEHAIQALDDLYERLFIAKKRVIFLAIVRQKHNEPEVGLYFWGYRGKTYLMDIF